jgi:hypothetical protein
MTSIQTIELLKPEALAWLRHLEIMQLIRISKPVFQEKTKDTADSDAFVIMQGLPEKENFEEWFSEWEASREDRVLPFQEIN